MKKPQSILTSCLFFYVGLFFCLFSSPLFSENLPPDIKRLREKKILVVALYKEDTEPFFMKDSHGKLTGMDVDLAQNIATRLHVGVDFIRDAATFDEVVDLVAARKADLGISMLSNTLGRAQVVSFTNSYLSLKQTIVVNRKMAARFKKGGTPAEWFRDRDSTLGVLSGSSYVEYARNNFPEVSLMLFNDSGSMFQAVLEGKVFGLFSDHVDVTNWFAAHPETGLYLQSHVLEKNNDPLAIAVYWEDTHLLLWLNLYLKQIQDDGTLEQLQKKYGLVKENSRE
jgi:polar amino acid transport system substrate-binding protein